MLDGVNDHPEHARELVRLLQGPAGEGQPDSVQSVPGHAVPALQRGGDRTVPRHPQCERRDRDHAAHARRRHRCRLRPAGRPRQRPHDSSPGLEAHLSGGATVKRAATIVAMLLAVLACAGGCTSTRRAMSTAAAGARRPRSTCELGIELPAQGQPAAGARTRSIARSSRIRATARRTWPPACCTTGSARREGRVALRAARVALEPKNPEFKNNYAVYLCQQRQVRARREAGARSRRAIRSTRRRKSRT